MEQNMISIVIPMYNSAPYIKQTVASVLRQTFTDFELIVIDDGSSDGSRDVVLRLAEADSRVAVHSIENRGVSHARNLGCSLANGEFIAFLDSDDIWLPNKLELQYHALQDSDSATVGVGCWFSLFNESDSERLSVVKPRWDRTWILDWLLFKEPGPLMPSTLLVTAKAITEVGGFDVDMSTVADADFSWKLVNHGKVITVDQSLVLYRQSTNQMSRNTNLLRNDYQTFMKREPFVINPHLRRQAMVNLEITIASQNLRRGRLLVSFMSAKMLLCRYPREAVIFLVQRIFSLFRQP